MVKSSAIRSLGNPGFEIEDWIDSPVGWVESGRIDECVSWLISHNIPNVGISRFHGYTSRSIDFILKYPQIKGLLISNAEQIELSPIQQRLDLEYLFIAETKERLKLSGFTKLRYLHFPNAIDDNLPQKSPDLHELGLAKYKSPNKNLATMPLYSKLKNLHLIQPTLESLSGVERFHGLKTLTVSYGRRLELIAPINKAATTKLMLNNCPNVADWNRLSDNETIEELVLNKCGSLPSVEFVKSMKRLRDIRIIDTNILDGNVLPLLTIKEFTILPEKRHYSHTTEELYQLKSKQPSSAKRYKPSI